LIIHCWHVRDEIIATWALKRPQPKKQKIKKKTDFKKAVAHKRKMLNCCAWPISRPELVGKKKKIG
jgi:hypothetical protein